VERDGTYAVVASVGGKPENPHWYHNLVANPDVELQDGPDKWDMVARKLQGDERSIWWNRAVEVLADYAEYQAKTSRVIPVFALECRPS
jgi:F420H(2)-dependent quinone reductase